MRTSVFFLMALGAFALVAAPASAEGVVALGHVSPSQLKATCDKVGGSFDSGSDNYNCMTDKGSVFCDTASEECVGYCDSCGQALVGGATGPGGLSGVLNNAVEPTPGIVFPIKPGLLQVNPTFSTQGQATTAP